METRATVNPHPSGPGSHPLALLCSIISTGESGGRPRLANGLTSTLLPQSLLALALATLPNYRAARFCRRSLLAQDRKYRCPSA